MSRSSNYQEQFKRLERWYKRFEEINNGRIHNRPSEFYEDEVYSFFMNCYHLKDWIKNDLAAASLANNVEDYINDNPEFLLCADICNGLKHFQLNRERSGKSPEFGKKKAKLEVGVGPPIIALKYEIITNTGIIDAFILATKCMELWKIFLKLVI